jgi:hypothetical protein
MGNIAKKTIAEAVETEKTITEDTKAIETKTDQVEKKIETVEDDFDLKNLVLPQSFIETAGVKKLLTHIPVRRPDKQTFIRVHPDPTYRATMAVVELRDEREMYLLTPEVAAAMPNEFSMACVFTAITRQGNLFLWPVKLPQPDGKVLSWHQVAMEAAMMAMDKWLRVVPNMGNSAYDIYEAQGVIPDPTWPSLEFKELLRIAWRDKLVKTLDHPLIKRLHGLAF